jgi:hypothetical protein
MVALATHYRVGTIGTAEPDNRSGERSATAIRKSDAFAIMTQ